VCVRVFFFYLMVASASRDLLFELKEVHRTLVKARDLEDWVALLMMELVQLLQVVQVCACLAFHRVELLDSCFEMKGLSSKEL